MTYCTVCNLFYRSPDIDQDNRNREIGQSSADEFRCIEYGSIPDQYLFVLDG